MSESIQKSCLAVATRRHEFLAHAAAIYGRPSAVDLAATDDLDDAGAVLLAFPWLSDPELTEALWALAQF
jgi:hypothetical protein